MNINVPEVKVPRVVIVGCGFGGLQLAKSLADADVQVVLLDKNNYFTFQPLLYQVATAGLEADSIAYPIRKIFKGQRNFHFRMATVEAIERERNLLQTNIGDIAYDYLVLATGSTTNFFGKKDFEANAMPMKSVTETLNLRSLMLQNFERALLVRDVKEQEALMTFVVVGGGPTGVELAGALSELKKHVLPNDYPELDFRKMRVILIENGNNVLQMMNESNKVKARKYLEELGAELWLNTSVSTYDGAMVTTNTNKSLHTATLIWAAGIKGVLVNGLQPEAITPRSRIATDEYSKVVGCENIFAIGDVAAMSVDQYPNGHPQVAPVAIQQAELLAKNLQRLIQQKPLEKFVYRDKGTMATVGRNKAVVETMGFHFGGFFGWFVWMALHLMLLVGYRNRLVVFINWLWNYISYDRNIRLIIRPYSKTTVTN